MRPPDRSLTPDRPPAITQATRGVGPSRGRSARFDAADEAAQLAQDARGRPPDRLSPDVEERDREAAVPLGGAGRRSAPPLLVERAVGEQLADRDVEDPIHLEGVRLQRGPLD